MEIKCHKCKKIIAKSYNAKVVEGDWYCCRHFYLVKSEVKEAVKEK